MNRIFTLLMLGILCVALKETNAQTVVINFDSSVPNADCWTNVNFVSDKDAGPDGSRAAGPKGFTLASLTTPFIDISEGGTISFDYLATDNAYNYNLTVRLISLSGSTVVSTLTLTNTVYQSYVSPTLTAGTYRVALEYSSNADRQLGQHYINLDNLSISGNYHYSNFCNSTPVGVADTYTAVSFASPTVSGNVLTNDTDPNIATNGETLSVVSTSAVSEGTLTLSSDGNFVFTPNASFTGGPVTFTYTVSDNGYMPITSTPITVTINYPVAPVAVDDAFGGPLTATPFSSDVIPNDSKPSYKTLVASLVAGPASGQVTLNANGTFTYTPPPGFTGGDVTFTYQVSYDTYMPLSSNIATVTISYPETIPAPLPIKLLSFTGQLVDNKAQLNWLVDDNETGNYFKVEKSIDSRNFKEAALVFASGKHGRQDYSFAEPITSERSIFYRLQIVNNDASIAYSKTVLIRSQLTTANTGITLLTNPVSSTLRFTLHTDIQEPSTVNIYTLNGTIVATQQQTTVKGVNYIEVESSSLPKGMYILEVNSKTTSRKAKFLK